MYGEVYRVVGQRAGVCEEFSPGPWGRRGLGAQAQPRDQGGQGAGAKSPGRVSGSAVLRRGVLGEGGTSSSVKCLEEPCENC